MAKSSPPPVERAFTLIELAVVIAAIFILGALTLRVSSGVVERAKATKDMSNLRQIGTATQTYMNDNSGILPGSTTVTWTSQLELNQKYLSTWRILESPFDKRSTSELGDGTTAISYGINSNVVGISADKITKPSEFIVFAPAQRLGTSVSFQGVGNSPTPGVEILAATSTPGGAATGGTQNSRTKINALFADWHVETRGRSGTGTAFTHTTSTTNDPDGYYRWNPQ